MIGTRRMLQHPPMLGLRKDKLRLVLCDDPVSLAGSWSLESRSPPCDPDRRMGTGRQPTSLQVMRSECHKRANRRPPSLHSRLIQRTTTYSVYEHKL